MTSGMPHRMDPTHRFSGRVQNYVKYRPGYPPLLIPFLREELGLARDWVIADVGSGTGKLAEAFLQEGYTIIGVEPNLEMRRAGEALLSIWPRFRSIEGTAERSTLESQSIDLVVAGQAFHWFDPEPTRTEFRRILRGEGWVALIWNTRTEATEFLKGYEALMKANCRDYDAIKGGSANEAALAGFLGSELRRRRFDNAQTFNWDELKGRLLSSSYVPAEGPALERLMRDLRALFEAHALEGRVRFLYDTDLFYGRLGSAGSTA